MSTCQATRRSVRCFRLAGLLLSCAAGVFFAATRPAVAADDTTNYYNFKGGGVTTDWMDLANWNDIVAGNVPSSVLPGPGSTADISGGLTATIGNPPGVAAPTISVEQVYIGGDGDSHGPATFPNPAPPPATIQYPAVSTGNGTLNQNSGTLNVGVVDPTTHPPLTSNNGWFVLGHVAGSTGTYNLTGTGTLNLSNDSVQVGTNGNGVLNLKDNAVINTTGYQSGRWTTGTGTTVMGNGTDNPTINTSGDFNIADQGNATFTQNSGAVNQTGGWSFLGNSGGSTGTYNMNGGTFQTNGWLVSGRGGTGNFNQINGSVHTTDTLWIGVDGGSHGNYTLTNGTLDVDHDTRIAPNGGSTGTLTIHGGVFNQNAGDIHVGENGNGKIVQDGGTLNSETSGNWVNIGMGGSGTGTGEYDISNGATANIGTAGARLVVGGNGKNGHGTMRISGAATVVNSNNEFDIGSSTGSTGDVIQTGGTVNANGAGVWIGNNINGGGPTAGTGTYTLSGDSTSVLNTQGLRIGVDGGGHGTFTQTGGVVNQLGDPGDGNHWTVIGGGDATTTGAYIMSGGTANLNRVMLGTAGTGTFVQSGGVLNIQKDISVGDSGGNGVYTISGPSSGPNATVLNTTLAGSTGASAGGGIQLGWNTPGVFNQNGGIVNAGTSTFNGGVQFGGNNSTNGGGVYNLSGGILNAFAIFKANNEANSNAVFNFNGGTLSPTADNTTYMQGLVAANVQAGGAIVDLQGHNVTIAQNLLHDPGIPATTADGGLTLNDAIGGGSLTLTGNNTFNGVTNVVVSTLNVNSSNALGGSTLNLVPANAGTVVFDSASTGITAFTLGGLSGSVNRSLQTAAASDFALTVGGNGFSTTYSGVLSNGLGVTKVGGGTLTLSAAQTYGGPTAINGGTLRLTSTASLPASSAVTVGGASASGAPTISGTGSVLGSLRVNGNVGGVAGHVAPGINTTGNFGAIGTLSVGSLTLGNGSFLDFDFGAPGTPFGASDRIASTGALTLPTSGSVVLNLSDAGGFGVGTYKLITESSTSNFTSTRFSVGANIVGFQEAFSNPGGTEVDMIVTPAPTWKAVAVSNDWADPANWLNGVPGSTTGLSSDIASFVTNSNFLNPTPDHNRDVSGIVFDQAAVGVYVIGSTGGNALLLTPGGTIQTTSLVANTETINAPLVIQGTDSTYTFLSNASDNTKSLVFGGSVSATGGNTVLTLTGSNTSNNAVNGVISNGTATSLSIVKNGAGTWVLGGNNTFNGGVLLSSGTVAVGNNNALGTGALTADGGALAASTGGPYTVSNPVTILSGLTVSGADDFTLSGLISGAGPLTKTGASTVTLTHNNTFGGGVALNSGTLRVGNNGALGSGTLTSGGGGLSTDANGPYTVANNITLNSNLTLSGVSNLTLSGAISGSGGLNKTGANTLTLPTINSFSGGVTISGGQVNVGPTPPSTAASPLGTGTVTLTGTTPTLNLRGYQSSGAGLLGQFYSVAPANVGNQDPAYSALSTMNAKLDAFTPTVIAATVVGGKADLNFTSGGTLGTDPITGGFTGGGGREYIFNKAGATTAAYGFPTPIPFLPAGAAPGGTVGLDNFQVRMSGFINITHPDNYTFTTTSDDGSVLFIDGGDGATPNDDTPLVNNNLYQGMTLKSGSVFLTAGLHAISVGFYEGGGGLGLGVTYADQSGTGDTGGLMMAIPNSVLSYSATVGTQSYVNNVVVTADSTINVSNALNASMGSLSLGANTLNVTSTDATATPYSLTFNGATTLTGNGTVNVANSTGGGTGRVNLSNVGGAFSLTKTGPGVLSFNGVGTFSGGTVISGGSVIANGPGTIGTGAVTFNNTTTLRAVAIGNGGFATVIPNLDNSAAAWTVNGTAAGFTGQGFTGTGNATTLQLTDSTNNEASSAWFNTPQAINNSLRVKFTYQMTGGGGNPADGAAFVIQNDPAGTAALGGGGGSLGYVGINNGAAFEINVYNGHTIGTAFVSGTSGTYSPVTPVNIVGDLTTGDVINVTLVYSAINGTVTQTLNDTTNNTTFTSVLPLGNNTIASIVGSNTALIGFTGATGGLNAAHTFSNFEFDSATSSVYTNDVVVNGGSIATIDVGASSAVSTVAMGALTVGSGAGTTLNVTATTAPSNTAYGLTLGPATVNGNVGINVANNGTARGTLTLTGASNLAAGVTVNHNSGILQLNNTSGPATVGSGVTVNVASAASMVLAGTVSDLSGNGANPVTPANRAHIVNSSTLAGGGGLVVTGTNQQVGAIDGTGATVVNAGASLTANHIVQSALVIGGTATNPATVIIAASDPSGNPMAGGSAIAGSSEPMNLGGSGLLTINGSTNSSPSLGGSAGGAGLGGSVAAVPEPSSILLVVLGSLACLVPIVRRKARKA